MKLDPVPLFFTKGEVEEFLVMLIKENFYKKISTQDMVDITKLCNFKVKSMSNNSIQGSYYGMKVWVRTRNSIKYGVVQVLLT